MHATGSHALGIVAASRAWRRTLPQRPRIRTRQPARNFGSSRCLFQTPNSNPAPEDPEQTKPANESSDRNAPDEDVRELEDADAEPLSPFTAKRSRASRMGGTRARHLKRRVADDLPPFTVPSTFLEDNVTIYDWDAKVRTGFHALKCDKAVEVWERLQQASWSLHVKATQPDTSQPRPPVWLFSHLEDDARYPDTYSPHSHITYHDTFRSVLNLWTLHDTSVGDPVEWHAKNILGRCSIIGLSAALAIKALSVDKELGLSSIKDSHIITARLRDPSGGDDAVNIPPERKEELDANLMSIMDDMCATAEGFLEAHEGTRKEMKEMGKDVDWPVAVEIWGGTPEAASIMPEISDHWALFTNLCQSVRADLEPRPAGLTTSNDFRRPINVISLKNYPGKRLTTLLMKYIASQAVADLVRVDALDLSRLVGGYLGQDWAYSKGPLSMLGFRVAELSESAGTPIKWPAGAEEDAEDDATVLQFSAHDGDDRDDPMSRELAKIRENPRDYVLPSVDKWENLKIDKALEGIVAAAGTRGPKPSTAAATTATTATTKTRRRLIVQVDDIVELNMTIEGSLLVARLRKIVDDMWLDGYEVILVGTSSVDKLSEKHVASLRELSLEDSVTVITVDNGNKTPWSQTMAQLDFVKTNLTNAYHMWRTLSGCADDSSELAQLRQYIRDVQTILRNHNTTALVPRTPNGSAVLSLAQDHWTLTRKLLQRLLLATWGGDGSDLCKAVLPSAELYRVVRDGVFQAGLGKQSKLSRCPDPVKLIRLPLWSRATRLALTNGAVNAGDTGSKAAGAGAGVGSGAGKLDRPGQPLRGQKLIEHLGISNDYEKKLLTGLIDKDEIRITFKDVHAPAETIEALKLLTSLSLKRPDAFSYGVLARDRIPGCLLYGPPGTGKTLLAKAVAKECGASMLEVSAASINEMWVGQGEKNVQALFSLAKKLAPLVIFIDEADALLAARSTNDRKAHRETINQFLREWDGMSDMNAFIMVATNRPFDLDEAVLRRLPRKILVDLPQQPDRRAILHILLRDEQLAPDVSIDALSEKTTLYSGSDLKNLCVAAAMAAVREEVQMADLHTGPEPYRYPERRLLTGKHFEAAQKEISASISDDMKTMREMRKFDETYGKPGRKKGRMLGFGVVGEGEVVREASVRREEGSGSG